MEDTYTHNVGHGKTIMHPFDAQLGTYVSTFQVCQSCWCRIHGSSTKTVVKAKTNLNCATLAHGNCGKEKPTAPALHAKTWIADAIKQHGQYRPNSVEVILPCHITR
jgi:hypothetical protein